MKQISFNKTFTVEKQKDDYSILIKKISELIKRPYMVTFKLVEKLEPGYVQFLYEESLSKWRSKGFKSPEMMFWTERKKKLSTGVPKIGVDIDSIQV